MAEVRMTQRKTHSSVEVDNLTHTGANSRLLVNITVSPKDGDFVADVLVHRGPRPHDIAYSVTTTSVEDLLAAGEALLNAAAVLQLERNLKL